MIMLSIRKTAVQFFALVGTLFLCAIYAYFRGPAIFAFLALAILIWSLSSRLEWGWYVLVALSPFIHWEIYLSDWRAWFAEYSMIMRMHAPAVEFWTVILIAAFGVYLLRAIISGRRVHLRAPGLIYFVIFFATALLSVINVAPWDTVSSLRYALHFILLFYIGYLFLGANIISDANIWRRSLRILFGAGVLGALMGLSSLFLGLWQYGGFRRAVPYALWGWAPLGDQHIFLAELLTVAFPIGVYFWRCADQTRQKFWLYSSLFILIIGLLTLSRAGWVTFAFESAVALWVYRRELDWPDLRRRAGRALIIFLPIIIYLIIFLVGSATVSRSNSARVEIARVAWFYWLRHPIVGNGVGSFVPILSENYAFTLDFGDPTDALGIAQKLLAEQGILGLVAFAIFVGALWRRARSVAVSDERLLSIVLVLSPVVFQLFNTQFYSSKMWVPIALGVAASYVCRKK